MLEVFNDWEYMEEVREKVRVVNIKNRPGQEQNPEPSGNLRNRRQLLPLAEKSKPPIFSFPALCCY